MELDRAVRTMLDEAIRVGPGGRVLILAEDAGEGFYGPGLAAEIAARMRRAGLAVTERPVPFHPLPQPVSPDLVAAMRSHDATLFLARLGDQLRFDESLAEVAPVVCYAIDLEMMGSAFGHLRGLRALKTCVDRALWAAREVRITCPLGTDLWAPGAASQPEDTTVRRFPLAIHSPVPASLLHGVVAQTGFLVGTGATYYEPYGIGLQDSLRVRIEAGRITAFDGRARDVAAAEAHYRDVAARAGLDPWTVHSWHAGIHPGCSFRAPAGDNLARWSGAAFGNPRLLHFHTCGDTPPGEICLNVVDPTITVDGVALWEDGQLRPERVAGGAAALSQSPNLAAALRAPAREIGLGPSGRLAFADATALVD
ncbi:MAG: hypothetical protein AAGA32_00685 [Pseudomonadota bacterium]